MPNSLASLTSPKNSKVFDLTDKKLVNERCQERKKDREKRLEEERIFFEAYIFNQFIETFLELLGGDKRKKGSKGSCQVRDRKSRPRAIKPQPQSRVSKEQSHLRKRTEPYSQLWLFSPPDKAHGRHHKHEQYLYKNKPHEADTFGSEFMNHQKMIEYRELAEQNKPYVTEPERVSTKGPHANVKWNNGKNRITVRLSRSSHSQILIGNAINLPPKKPRTIKRASTALGVYTTRILNENDPEDLEGKPLTAPESIDIQKTETNTDPFIKKRSNNSKGSKGSKGSTEGEIPVLKINDVPVNSSGNAGNDGNLLADDGTRKTSGPDNPDSGPKGQGKQKKSTGESVGGHGKPGTTNKGDVIVNFMAGPPPAKKLQQIYSKVENSLVLSTPTKHDLAYEIETIMARKGRKSLHSGTRLLESSVSLCERIPNQSYAKKSIQIKNRSKLSKNSNSKLMPRRIHSA